MVTSIAADISRADLAPTLAGHSGNRALAHSLEQVAEGPDLVRILGRYITFNAPFGGGVANLAGEIAVRRHLFRDPEEAVELLADRSGDVAAAVFFAAVDEFGDRSLRQRVTHRALAQATLKATAEFYGCAAALDELARPTPATLDAIDEVQRGYLLDRACDDRSIFQALGFHAGSELLADEEFRLIDGSLRARFPDLVRYLSETETQIGNASCPAYVWISIHTSVEADHFEFAVKGANAALRYATGSEDRAHVKQRILDGFQHFSALQTKFMQCLSE